MYYIRHKLIGVLEQEPTLFNDTLLNNLTYGLDTQNKEQIMYWCDWFDLFHSQLYNFVTNKNYFESQYVFGILRIRQIGELNVENVNIFDMMADGYDTSKRIQIAKLTSDAIREYLVDANNKNVIDFGCGTGLVGMNLLNDFNSMLFLDTSQNMLDQIKQKIIDCNIQNPYVSILKKKVYWIYMRIIFLCLRFYFILMM